MNVKVNKKLARIDDVHNYDPEPAYKVIKQATYKSHGKIEILSGHEAYHVINFSDVKRILGDNRCIRGPSNDMGGPSILPTLTPKDLLLNLDFPEHTRLKRFVSKDYSRKSLQWLVSYINTITNDFIDHMLDGSERDLFTEVLDNVSIYTNCKLLGINLEDRHYFRSLAKTVQISDKNDVENLTYQFEKLYKYLMEHVNGDRTREQYGLIDKFIETGKEVSPPLNNGEIVSLLLGSLLGGDQNTLTVMTKIIYAAISIPEVWSDLSSFPELRDKYIEEFLRLTNLGNTSTFPRIANHDISISSGVISKGSVIYADVFMANRDPSVFVNPLEINPYRDSVRHLQFGYGMHNCMGQELARIEIRAVIDVLVTRLPQVRLKEGKELIRWSEGIILRRPDSLPITVIEE
ncbi:cytochrome P450 [Vibrio sp. S4M6]|uniref:cytochrome P450 n=1 Tax=Vibrio sinus TaxID=2946865 RepID=UPI002029FFA8|nr:cytochrome P450 [Vibrio sinus]MCL9782106.1 cytochrome P450 [Vibrio sinus]